MRRMTTMIAICALLAASTTALASTGIFLKIPGVPGTADCPGHRDFVKAESVILAPDTDGEGGIVSITKLLDKASPKLGQYETNETKLPGSQMHITKTSHGYAKTLFNFRFEDVQVTRAGSADLSEFQRGLLGKAPAADVGWLTFRYGDIQWEYTPTKDGQREGCRGILVKHGSKRLPLAAFGIGATDNTTRVGIVARNSRPSGLLSGERIQGVVVALLGKEGPRHLLSIGRAGIDMTGTINPSQVGIVSEDDPLFGVILSPTQVKFGQ